MKTDLNGNDKRDIKTRDIKKNGDEKMSNGKLVRIGKFIDKYKLYFAGAIILFIFLYTLNIGGIKDIIQNFFTKINEDISYILFQTYFIRGVIEGILAYGSYLASKRTQSDKIRKTTQIVFFVMLLLAIYDLYPAIKYLLEG